MESIGSSNLDLNITLNQLKPLGAAGKEKAAAKSDAGEALASFGRLFQEEMNKINTLQADANRAVETYASGGGIDLHNVVMAVEKADMALQLAVQVRNRLVAAYQEVYRMQV